MAEPTVTAAAFLPEPWDPAGNRESALPTLREAASRCHGCELWTHATQTVFGEGQPRARLMLVGEMPGDREDLAGKPFVGPAGRLLDDALEQAGIERDDAYVTNVVKHFKWEAKGKRRLHKSPGRREISACLPWLDAEIALIEPQVLVCLGATAAKALLGASFKVTEQRGQLLTGEAATKWAPQVIATIHPSSLLRLPPEVDRQLEIGRFVADLRVAQAVLGPPRR